jgi:Glycosyltransferase family 87
MIDQDETATPLKSGMPLLNAKRLRDYPRLMLFSTWLILGLNLLLHQGWIGAFGQVIAGDFIMFYSTGMIFRSNPGLIFDYETQTRNQQALVAPSILPGYNPFMNPPFVAPIYSIFTYLSLHWALILWTILAISSVFLSAYWLLKLVPSDRNNPGLSYTQLVILILSFFPFIEGLQAGQNHWLTLLLVTGIIFSMFREKWYLSGILAGLLIYKPQFVLGFIIIWLVWGKFKALVAFAAVSLAWVASFALGNGLGLYRTYLQLSQVFMDLPYIAGFPRYLLVTFYGLLTSFLPQNTQPILSSLSTAILFVSAIGLAWLAFKLRKQAIVERIPALVAALIFPLLATPYALLHDLVILVPAFVLWAIYSYSRNFLYIAISIYLGAFFLTFIAALTKIAWVSLLVIGLLIAIIMWIISKQNKIIGTGLLK